MLPTPVEGPVGPDDAAFLPRMRMTLYAPGQPVTEPVAKLGGSPVWLTEPAWPVSPTSGEPLMFIGQFPVPVAAGEVARLAYLFLEEDSLFMGGLDGPDEEPGDAALIVQPGGRVRPGVRIGPPGITGPTLWTDAVEQVPVEWLVDLAPFDPRTEEAIEQYVGWSNGERGEPDVWSDDPRDWLAGRPLYPNFAVVGRPWRFFFQLHDLEGTLDDPYFLNFGGGTGHAYLSTDGLEGIFVWQGA
ncbi:hypothetical protein [Yinghuangia soli]|uniref:DUF1963 domain-containing protein n=1 Tax=Yinghuangia soli TaxID=2908204 RepID=A0AA41PWM3_9ACTN|nr:hypothetical protein [Yinghuangia soli]MCF2527073.1 hypothetical protein [Yinghuangia soli]